jgi:tRNA(adenine34) deaminase
MRKYDTESPEGSQIQRFDTRLPFSRMIAGEWLEIWQRPVVMKGDPMTIDHERYMRVALEEAEKAGAEGNSAVGSVIVRDGDIIGRGRNLVYTTHDVTAHAETVALRETGGELKLIDFSGCTLYTTFEPCPMCCGAILLSGVSRLVMGGRNDPTESAWGGYQVDRLIEQFGRSSSIEIVTGVLVPECLAVRQRFR